MSRRVVWLFASLVASAPAWSLEPDALFAKVEPSVWTVVASDAQGRGQTQGSAVVIGTGRLVTNCHVLARMTRIQVTKANVSYGAKLEFPDPENDLCQLRVDNFQAPAVELAASEALRVGARVLQDCIKRAGSVEGGLRLYVGAVTTDGGWYIDKVMSEHMRIQSVALGKPLQRYVPPARAVKVVAPAAPAPVVAPGTEIEAGPAAPAATPAPAPMAQS